jgi:hypothetical protein
MPIAGQVGQQRPSGRGLSRQADSVGDLGPVGRLRAHRRSEYFLSALKNAEISLIQVNAGWVERATVLSGSKGKSSLDRVMKRRGENSGSEEG